MGAWHHPWCLLWFQGRTSLSERHTTWTSPNINTTVWLGKLQGCFTLYTVSNQLVEHYSNKYETTHNFLNYRGDRLWAPPTEVTWHVIICTFGMLTLLRLPRGPPRRHEHQVRERSIPGTLSVGMCLMLEFKLFGPPIHCNWRSPPPLQSLGKKVRPWICHHQQPYLH